MGDRLKNKVAIVTGAGSGIGRACALRFAAEGARVVVNDVRPEAAEAVEKEIEKAGGTASAFACDVSDSAKVDAMVAAAVDCYGALDALVNNAASPRIGWIAETSDEDWRAAHAVTLDGAFYGVRAALRAMLPKGKGSIVNVASGAGVGAEFMLGGYGSAKAGLIQLTKTAAVENAARGVRVNVICPGSIATPPLMAWAESVPGGKA
ncbi:MAG: SDR family oxidoreductase, partial [Candidatus Methylomirabilis sp.]|nr:SDR family oxidoreductase [Deltaproteobacteria bacterium]